MNLYEQNKGYLITRYKSLYKADSNKIVSGMSKNDLVNLIISTMTIKDLELHEQANIHSHLTALRVPSGWLYQYYNEAGEVITATFVSYSSSFV